MDVPPKNSTDHRGASLLLPAIFKLLTADAASLHKIILAPFCPSSRANGGWVIKSKSNFPGLFHHPVTFTPCTYTVVYLFEDKLYIWLRSHAHVGVCMCLSAQSLFQSGLGFMDFNCSGAFTSR